MLVVLCWHFVFSHAAEPSSLRTGPQTALQCQRLVMLRTAAGLTFQLCPPGGPSQVWMKEEDICHLTLFNGAPISVQPPNFTELVIVETDPGVRGDTSGSGGKPATLETGAVVRVPLFVQENEKITVDTRTGEYVSRVKD